MVVVGAGADATADGGVRKAPYLQNLSRTTVTVMLETRPARPCSVTVSSPGQCSTCDAEPRTVVGESSVVHELTVGELRPGHRYRYEVTCEGSSVGGGEFATAPEADAPFMFVVFGDSRSVATAHGSVVERIRSEVPDFLVGTGDIVNEGGIESDWQTFFDIEAPLLADHVLFPVVGNHDRQGRGRTADNYRRYFSLPENSPDPERYYAFTWGNARFLMLDSNTSSFSMTDQTAWIEKQLQAAHADPRIRHIFVSMHHPPFSVALHGGHEELRDAWTPLFEKYRVTAVFSGHDHCYERMFSNNVHYFVAGGGGAPLYPRSRRPSKRDVDALRYYERVNHYLRIHISGEFVEISAFRNDGSLIETMSWGNQRRDDMLVAQVAQGSPVGAGDADVPDIPGDALASSAESARASVRPAGDGGGLGTTGIVGAGLLLIAAGGLVWSFRP